MENIRQTQSIISPIEIMQLMTHNSLSLYKKKGTRAPINKVKVYEKQEASNTYKKGVVFVSPSKEALTDGQGFVVTSYETLSEQGHHLSHWTPNTYRGGSYYDFKRRYMKGHTKENLKQVNVIGFDIDRKDVDLYQLYIGCEEMNLPRPNLLLETPRGFQVFFILETPFYIHAQHNYKALRVAERLIHNIREALSDYAPMDFGCVPFGFYRIPKADNILDFHDELASTDLLLAWSKKYEEKKNKQFLRVIYGGQNASGSVDYTNAAWYQSLINARGIDKGHHSASRNNALLTLALANYASDRSFEETYDVLDQFNSNLNQPLPIREFERTLKSAYSGKYAGVKRSYVEGLLELWTDGKVTFQGGAGWYKHKKAREDRERSHYEEWEQDILNYINEHLSPAQPFLAGSLKQLCKLIGISLSSFKEVLKRSRKLFYVSVGRGRGAYTKLSSQSMLIKHVLYVRKDRSVQSTSQSVQKVISILPTKEAVLIARNSIELIDWKRGPDKSHLIQNTV
ncbi:primase C-terminal domain-containing protein [Bacillus sp. 1P06AnD]|uniref:primase C-terminal domain-containing protein n=1 Tax=Bacillus sp. 1P06AnD TaxID=3132208 RepID=UPI00399F1E79